jgi:hypothetical protein
MEQHISRQRRARTPRDHRGSPRQEENTLCQTNQHRKLLRDRQVSHGGSTWDDNYNGAHVPTSRGIPRYFALSIWRAYNLTLIGFPPPDNDLRRWLVSGESKDALKRLQGFAYSLLVVTRIALEKIVEQGKGGYPDWFPN